MCDGGAVMKTLLYIEDNPDNFKVLRMMLERLRPEDRILSARTAEAGIEIAERERPDLILMDLHLPGMDGYHALATLRKMPTTANIPVIAITADAMLEHIRQGLAAGFQAYVTKPVVMQKLGDTIDTILSDTTRLQNS